MEFRVLFTVEIIFVVKINDIVRRFILKYSYSYMNVHARVSGYG